MARGDATAARDHFGALVSSLQRRASRLAFRYLRDAADADEAVQDAFVKAFLHIATYREDLPFDVWFTRILVNGCLDRLKARQRRRRWLIQAEPGSSEQAPIDQVASSQPSPEDWMLAREQHQRLAAAVDHLAERQRTVFLLSQYDGRSAREISAMTGMNEATVRVHLFRAVRKLKKLLAPPVAAPAATEG